MLGVYLYRNIDYNRTSEDKQTQDKEFGDMIQKQAPESSSSNNLCKVENKEELCLSKK